MSSERDACLRKADDAKRRATQATEPSIESAYEKVAEHWMLLARLESIVAAEKTAKTPSKKLTALPPGDVAADAYGKRKPRACRSFQGVDLSRDQGVLGSLGHLCERLPAGLRDPHAHNAGLSTVGDHALALRGCESGLDQFDHHVDREPVRSQDRLGVTVTAPGEQFEGAAAVRIGMAIVASGRHRYSHNYRPDPPRPRDGSGLATAQRV